MLTKVYGSDVSKIAARVCYSHVKEIDSFLSYVSAKKIQKGCNASLTGHRPKQCEPETHNTHINSQSSNSDKVSHQFRIAVTRKFKTAISAKWKFKDSYIKALEMEAAIHEVPHMPRNKYLHGGRFVLLVDNMTSVGAITEDRSSWRN